MAVLGRLQPVPAAYLKQLATDNNVFPELPGERPATGTPQCSNNCTPSLHRLGVPVCCKCWGTSKSRRHPQQHFDSQLLQPVPCLVSCCACQLFLRLQRAAHIGLPLAAFSQVFEVDKALLQQHALPLLATYKYSEPYMLRALRMDEHLPFPGRFSGSAPSAALAFT